MDFSLNNAKAQKVWFDSENLWLLLVDGRQLSLPLAYFPTLLNAKPEERDVCELSGGGIGIHWNALDEDLYVPNLLMGITDINRKNKTAQIYERFTVQQLFWKLQQKRMQPYYWLSAAVELLVLPTEFYAA